MSIYLRKNALPIFIEIIFVVSCFFVPQEYYIYSNLLFYLLLFADFYVKRVDSVHADNGTAVQLLVNAECKKD